MAILKERLALLIDADTKGAVRGLNQVGNAARTDLGSAETSISKFTDTLRRSGPMIGAAIGVAGVAIASTTKAASDLAEAVNVTGLVFKGNSGAIDDYAKSAANAVGLSERAARAATAGFGGLLQNLGFANAETLEWSQSLTTLGADLASAFNTDIGEAITAISSGLRGESEPLKRFNVFLSETELKTKAVAMGLAGTTSEVTRHQKSQAALATIMEQTKNVQGDFANTSDGLANSQRILAANVEDLQAELGQALLPVVTDLVSGMNTAIDVGRQLKPVFTGIGESALGAADDVLDLHKALIGGIPGADVAGDALGFLGDKLGEVFGPRKSDIEWIDPAEFDEMQSEAAQALTSWLGLEDAVSSVAGLLGEAARAGSDAGGGLGDVAEEYESIFGELFAYQDALRGVEDGSRKVTDAHKAHADAQRDATSAAEDVRQAAIDVAEAMVVQFDATDAARRGIDDYASAQQAATDPVFAMIRALEQQDELLKKASKEGRVKKSGTKMTASGSAPTLLDFAEGAAGIQQAAIGLAGALRTGETSIGQVQDALKRWADQGLITEDQAHALGVTFAEAAGKANELEGANVSGAAAAGIAAEKLEAEKEAAERTRDAQDRLRSAQERLIQSQDRVTDTAEDVARAHDDATRKAWALDEAQRKLNEKVADNPGLVDAAKRQMQQWVDQGLVPAAQAAEDLKEMLAGVNQELLWNAVAMASLGSDKVNMPQIDPVTGRFSGATGGRVPGPMGQPVPILAHGGEMVTSNADLNRMANSTSGVRSAPLMVVEAIYANDVATAIREGMTELDAAQYRAGLN